MEGSGRKCLDDARRILGRVSRCARDALQPHTSVATIAVCLLVYSPPLVNSTEPSMSKVFCYDINFIKVGIPDRRVFSRMPPALTRPGMAETAKLLTRR